ncbi:hypothetical protein [Parasitella parasitica]|uniref:Uncharacterized protein n=1 Tax=Parasitella parasitica TaxID=35722 RepID=A0A0B7N4A7_9FUNG|nr:hypothetical protein [Parasitella parasitica]
MATVAINRTPTGHYTGEAIERRANQIASMKSDKTKMIQTPVFTDVKNLYVKNLDPIVNNEEFFNAFRVFGEIVSAQVITNQDGKSKGYGFVSFKEEIDADNARKALNKQQFYSKCLQITFHTPKNPRKSTAKGQGNSPRTPPFCGNVEQRSQAPRSPPVLFMPSVIPSKRSAESIISVSTESNLETQRQSLTNAIGRCGYRRGNIAEIVDMLMTLPKQEKSLCLFNLEYLKKKIKAAVDALTACQGDYSPSLSKSILSSTISIVPPPSGSRAIPIVSPYLKDIELLLASLKGLKLSKQKQLVGDKLFPLVKATGTKKAPKVTIYLLDTVTPLSELVNKMFHKEKLEPIVKEAFTAVEKANLKALEESNAKTQGNELVASQ